jgi:hypothetical protein
MSHGESESASSLANSAVLVDLVIGGSSSNSDDLLLLPKLFDSRLGDSPGGELPNSDMLV